MASSMTGECRRQWRQVSGQVCCEFQFCELGQKSARRKMRLSAAKSENHQSNWRRRSNEASASKQEAPSGTRQSRLLGRKSHRDHHNTLLATLVTTILSLLLLASNQASSISNNAQQLAIRRAPSGSGSYEIPMEGLAVEQITALPLLLLSPGGGGAAANGQHQHPDGPKIIPLSALESYQEGGELKLFCSASAPAGAGRLHFEWRKGPGGLFGEQPATSGGFFQSDQLQQTSSKALQSNGKNIHISMMDDSSSLLRLSRLEADDSGNYTCFARNQHGSDSSTVRVNVNVRLRWLREPPAEYQIKAGKSVQLECDATGQPAPLISWTSLRERQTINSKLLRIDRAQLNDSGLYECLASRPGLGPRNGHLEGDGESFLRKLVRLTVKGK